MGVLKGEGELRKEKRAGASSLRSSHSLKAQHVPVTCPLKMCQPHQERKPWLLGRCQPSMDCAQEHLPGSGSSFCPRAAAIGAPHHHGAELEVGYLRGNVTGKHTPKNRKWNSKERECPCHGSIRHTGQSLKQRR